MKTLVSWCILILPVFVVNADLKTPHLKWLDDRKCFPVDFDFLTQEQEYARLLVIPFLNRISVVELSKAKMMPTDNSRINDFITCMWKIRGYLNTTDHINYEKIQVHIENNYAWLLGDTEPGIAFSGTEAKRIVSLCRNITEDRTEVKVVLTRNCVLPQIKDFVTKISN